MSAVSLSSGGFHILLLHTSHLPTLSSLKYHGTFHLPTHIFFIFHLLVLIYWTKNCINYSVYAA